MTNEGLDILELDRAIGAVIGGAIGDALGAGYEFGPAPEPSEVTMRRGTLTRQPAGHWTDDTAMAIAILESAAVHGELTSNESVVAVGDRFLNWFHSNPADIGNHTAAVLARATSGSDLSAAAAFEQGRNPQSAGNGSLMRTGPVALAHLGNDLELARAAREMSALTHQNPDAVDACVLWTIAIDREIRLGDLQGPRAGLHMVEESRRDEWEERIREAETRDPREFNPNKWVVHALQAAWAAIYSTRMSSDHFVTALRHAVAIGDDTDTVAAIAGALLGARYGVKSAPLEWRDGLAGWPNSYDWTDLLRLAIRAARHEKNDDQGSPDYETMMTYYRSELPRPGL